MDNAVPEHDESEQEQGQLTKIFMEWSIPGPVIMDQSNPLAGFLPPVLMAYTSIIYLSNPSAINTPPPNGGLAKLRNNGTAVIVTLVNPVHV